MVGGRSLGNVVINKALELSMGDKMTYKILSVLLSIWMISWSQQTIQADRSMRIQTTQALSYPFTKIINVSLTGDVRPYQIIKIYGQTTCITLDAIPKK